MKSGVLGVLSSSRVIFISMTRGAVCLSLEMMTVWLTAVVVLGMPFRMMVESFNNKWYLAGAGKQQDDAISSETTQVVIYHSLQDNTLWLYVKRYSLKRGKWEGLQRTVTITLP